MPEEPAITCPTCGRTSYNPHDIAQRYCGYCHRFHDDQRTTTEQGALEEMAGMLAEARQRFRHEADPLVRDAQQTFLQFVDGLEKAIGEISPDVAIEALRERLRHMVPAEPTHDVHCSRCGKRVSGHDPDLGLIVRAWVQCPECLHAEMQEPPRTSDGR